MFYWRAFYDLSSERPIGMAPGQIPYSSMLEYADLHGMRSLDEFERFKSIIGELDREYLKQDDQNDKKPLANSAKVDDVSGIKKIMARQSRKKR